MFSSVLVFFFNHCRYSRVQEFQSENHLPGEEEGGVSKVAREISNTVTDPKIQESEVR